MKVIIDCDPGIDDIYAIAVALLNDDVDILAITIAHGNTAVENGALNTKLTLDTLFPHKKHPPIYLGSPHALVHKGGAPYHFFHRDGIAGCHETLYKTEVERLKEGFLKQVKSADSPHAANKIVEIVNSNPGEVVVVAIGALTNLALAIRLCHDPIEFTKNIKKLVIMGGNEPDGFSNGEPLERTLNYPEFNFKCDPIAAKIVLDNYLCPIRVYTFDFCLRTFRVETNHLVREFGNHINNSKRCHFLERIGIIHRLGTNNPDWFLSCDLAAVLALLHGDECKAVYKKLDNYTVAVENSKMDGLIVSRTEPLYHELNENVDVCVTMDPVATYEIFKAYLRKLAELDK